MSHLISNILKTITTENIKNETFIKTLIERVKKEIIDAQKKFIEASKLKRTRQIFLQTKNQILTTSNKPLDEKLSKKYCDNIKYIFEKNGKITSCQTLKNNYLSCENNKVKYYTELLKLLNTDNLIDGQNGFINIEPILYKEKNKNSKNKNSKYKTIINDFIVNFSKKLNTKIKNHNNKSKTNNDNLIKNQEGGKKTTTKKPKK